MVGLSAGDPPHGPPSDIFVRAKGNKALLGRERSGKKIDISNASPGSYSFTTTSHPWSEIFIYTPLAL